MRIVGPDQTWPDLNRVAILLTQLSSALYQVSGPAQPYVKKINKLFYSINYFPLLLFVSVQVYDDFSFANIVIMLIALFFFFCTILYVMPRLPSPMRMQQCLNK